MTQSIIPPPELVQQWFDAWSEDDFDEESFADYVAVRAAQWGADQELRAVCQLLFSDPSASYTLSEIRAARRPKPPSLKKQALEELAWVAEHLDMPLHNYCNAIHIIHRALEALPE